MKLFRKLYNILTSRLPASCVFKQSPKSTLGGVSWNMTRVRTATVLFRYHTEPTLPMSWSKSHFIPLDTMFFMKTVLSEVSPNITMKNPFLNRSVCCSTFFRLWFALILLCCFLLFSLFFSCLLPVCFWSVCKSSSFCRLACSLGSRLHLFHAPYFRRSCPPKEHSIQ